MHKAFCSITIFHALYYFNITNTIIYKPTHNKIVSKKKLSVLSVFNFELKYYNYYN